MQHVFHPSFGYGKMTTATARRILPLNAGMHVFHNEMSSLEPDPLKNFTAYSQRKRKLLGTLC